MQQPFSYAHMDLHHLFPSLFSSTERFRDNPYEAGWLLGCINDVAICFIMAYVRVHPASDINDHLNSARTFARRYLHDFCTPDSCIVDVGDLTDVVQMIHGSHTLATWRWPPATRSINTQRTQDQIINEIEQLFIDLVFEAVSHFVYDGDVDCTAVKVMG